MCVAPIRSGAAWRRGGSCCRMGAESSSPRRPSGCHSPRQVSRIRCGGFEPGPRRACPGRSRRRASCSSGLATRRRSTAAEVCARCSTSCPPRPRSSATCGTRCSTPPASSPRRRALAGADRARGAPARNARAPAVCGDSRRRGSGGLGAPSPPSARRLCLGADYVIDAAGLREQMLGADLVVTGEGVVDRTSRRES